MKVVAKMKNYHTHTYRCNHATGDVTDYAAVAVQKGLTVLGISDHTPLPDNRWSSVRMNMSLLEGYVNSIESAQGSFEGLTILKGMECEYSDEYYGFFKDELLGRYRFDYLVFGAHNFLMDGEWITTYGGVTNKNELAAYSEYVVQAMESGLYAFVAHPDVFGNSYEVWDAEAVSCSKYILEAAKSLKVPLELNGYGLRKPEMQTKIGSRPAYPWDQFWELAAEYDISVVANSDAHQPEDVESNINELYDKAKRLGFRIADLSYLER